MSFTRTNSGLTNMALFHGVDIIVFTEGGEASFSFSDVVQGKFNETSVDIKFWSGIFETYNFDKTVEFRALGSKTSTNKICELIYNKKINNVVVARDSDLDDFTNNKITSPLILYTKGYSWENDIYQKEIVQEQIKSMLFTHDIKQEYIDIIEDSYKRFYNQSLRLLKIEVLFRTNGIRLITACNGERFINGKSIPYLNKTQILSLVREKKSALERPANLSTIPINKCPITFSYGKLIEALALANITYIIGKLEGMKSLPKDLIVSSMIDRYFRKSEKSKDSYYSQLIDNLISA